MCEHLRQYHPEDKAPRLDCLRQLAAVDESCQETVELVTLLLEEGVSRTETVALMEDV